MQVALSKTGTWYTLNTSENDSLGCGLVDVDDRVPVILFYDTYSDSIAVDREGFMLMPSVFCRKINKTLGHGWCLCIYLTVCSVCSGGTRGYS